MKHTIPILVLALFGAVACRGGISKQPPVHPVMDMDYQEKLKAQSESMFAGWADGRGMRTPPVGTVARGSIADDGLVFHDEEGKLLPTVANPLPPTAANFARGRERFNIYCGACHDRSGSGNGMVLQRAGIGAFNPIVPDLATEQRLVDAPDGELFATITDGKLTMPGYGHILSVKDRWRIVHYLRALQHRMKN